MNFKKKTMKINIFKKSTTVLCSALLALSITSCKDDFLDEEGEDMDEIDDYGLEDMNIQ